MNDIPKDTRPKDTRKAMAKSLQSWWALAGVDTHYCDAPASLLNSETLSPVMQPKPVADKQEAQSVKTEPVEESGLFEKPKFPEQLDDFLNWFSNPQNLIEAQWARDFVVPILLDNPELLVITGMPEPAAPKGAALSLDASRLLSKMLIAAGYDAENCLIMPIALARSPDGQIDDKSGTHLKLRTQHLMKICGSPRCLVLGDTAARILFSEDLLHARAKKQFINHISSKTEAVVTFHPRSLLQRPELKAQAWKDLQMILRTSNT